MRRVVDASVVAKWLLPEPDSPYADALLDDELLVPDLLYLEVANILWKKQQRGEIDAAVSSLAARWLLQLPLQVHDGAGLMQDAMALAMRLRHPAYDCCYLALALREGATLITADRRLVARCHAGDAADLAGTVELLAAA